MSVSVNQWSLDEGPLDELRALESPKRPDFFAATLRMFLEQAPIWFSQIEASVASDDARAARHASHTLKSVSAMVGARSLSAVCAELETLARSGSLSGAEPLVARTREGLACTKAQLEELIGPEAPARAV